MVSKVLSPIHLGTTPLVAAIEQLWSGGGTWDFHSWLAQGLTIWLWGGCSTFLFVSWPHKKGISPVMVLVNLSCSSLKVSLLKVCGILWDAVRYLLPDLSYFLQHGSDHRLMIVAFLKCGCGDEGLSSPLIQWAAAIDWLCPELVPHLTQYLLVWWERIGVTWNRWQVCLGLPWQLESPHLDTALLKKFLLIFRFLF